jgi:hypothetical protein
MRPAFLGIVAALALLSVAGCDRSETVSENSASLPELPVGQKIVFQKGGNSAPYKAGGWSQPEEKFTWTEGTSAQLRIPVAPTTDYLSLKIRMAALVKAPELPLQPVQLFVNDQKIAEWEVSDTAEFVAAIPPEITKPGGVLTITVKTPKATSPKALGISADPRILGICCLDLELSKS